MVVLQIDHRISERLERALHVTDAFDAQQQTAKRIFTGKDVFDAPEALLEDRQTKALLTARFVFSTMRVVQDVRDHAATEDRLVVGPKDVRPVASGAAIPPNACIRRRLSPQLLDDAYRTESLIPDVPEWVLKVPVTVRFGNVREMFGNPRKKRTGVF